MGKRLVSLLTALALAVSAFASLTVAPAGAVVEEITGWIYFPFVPNGEEYGNMGPWYGTVTVQNPNDAFIEVELRKADDTTITTATLEPFAAKTWSSSALFGDGNGGGVVVRPGSVTRKVVRGQAADTVDRINNPCVGAVESIRVTQADTVFNEWNGSEASPTGDYTWTVVGNQIVIDWGVADDPASDFLGDTEPAPGTEYTVTVRCTETIGLPIAGVAKIVAPVASNSGRTSAQHEAVSGYSALPQTDVEIGGQHNLVFPIVQTNTGWNSVLHVTNFDSRNNCSVTVTLYQSPSGYSDPSYGQFTKLLNKGQTWHIDLAEQGVPAGWVGQAWVSTDCNVAATVDRVKPAQPWGDPVNMALTNQALPVQAANTNQALPLIFQGYNGWNTGISIANLDPNAAANVTITYYNSAGVAVGTDSRVIQPRAMEFVYRPATTDVGIGGFGSALVTSNRPVLVAVDSVKYTGADQDVGQALGYLAQRGTPAAGGQLFMPLFQKQGLLSGGNDNSGVALFNAGTASAPVALWAFDSSGALVAPTLDAPVTTLIPAHGQFIFYAPSYGEMPGGFQGSIWVVANGNVVGVSNNVNYDVQFDGSAAYNMPVDEMLPGMLACTVNVDGDWELAVNLGVPQSVDVIGVIQTSPAEVLTGTTGTDGQVVLVDGTAGADETPAQLYLDVDGNGELGPGDVLLAEATCPAVLLT